MMLPYLNEIVRNVIYKEYFVKEKTKLVLPHIEAYPFLKNVIVDANVSEVLKYVLGESAHLTFTSLLTIMQKIILSTQVMKLIFVF